MSTFVQLELNYELQTYSVTVNVCKIQTINFPINYSIAWNKPVPSSGRDSHRHGIPATGNHIIFSPDSKPLALIALSLQQDIPRIDIIYERCTPFSPHWVSLRPSFGHQNLKSSDWSSRGLTTSSSLSADSNMVPSRLILSRPKWCQDQTATRKNGNNIKTYFQQNFQQTTHWKERCPNISIAWGPPELLHKVINVRHNCFLHHCWRMNESVWKTRGKVKPSLGMQSPPGNRRYPVNACE